MEALESDVAATLDALGIERAAIVGTRSADMSDWRSRACSPNAFLTSRWCAAGLPPTRRRRLLRV